MIRIADPFRYVQIDLENELRLFFGDAEAEDFEITVSPGAEIRVEVASGGDCETFRYAQPDYFERTELAKKRLVKRCVLAAFFRFLQRRTGKKFPYGAFTGIRPTKQYYQIAAEGLDPADFFLNFLDFAPEKFELVREIVEAQRIYYDFRDDNLDIYVGIPFCRGRCSYCSFVSCDITKAAEWEAPYVDALLAEIAGGLETIRGQGWKIRSLYIGGGTPSSLSKSNIERILRAVSGLGAPEFTFEAGRPDSIDEELLNLLNAYGVDRISVNPQSANDRTLALIGRRHTFADAVEKFELAKRFNFGVNMDLIMGLADEGSAEFAHTLKEVFKLEPDNVTVHSLALKRGSRLKETEPGHFCRDIGEMSELAARGLKAAGYRPYYMYRQKYSAGNLENTGYAKPGRECVYNIDNMEEIASVLAFGANAISKRVYSAEDRIERFPNPKDIPTYVAKTAKLIADKAAFRRNPSEK